MRIPLAFIAILLAVFVFAFACTMPIRLQWTRVYSLQPIATRTVQTTPYIYITPPVYHTRIPAKYTPTRTP